MAYKFEKQADGSVLFIERENDTDTIIQSVAPGKYEIQNRSDGLRIATQDNQKELLYGKQRTDFIDNDNNPFATIEDLVRYYAVFFINAPAGSGADGAIDVNVYTWRDLPPAVEINGVQVITLDEPKAYKFHDVDLEGRVIVCDNPSLTILGFSSETSAIKSTGKPAQDTLLQDVPMVTFLQTCAMRWVSLKDSDYPVLKDAPSGAFDWFGVNTENCQRGFVTKNALFDIYTGCAVVNGGSWQIDGSINAHVLRDCIVRGNNEENAKLVDVTANAVITGRIRLEGTPFLTQLASQTGIFIDPAAAFPAIEATTNYPFQLENCRFGTLGTPLDGRQAGDGFTVISTCPPLVDSKTNGFMYFENNATTTNIINPSELVEIEAGTNKDGFLLLPDSQEWELVNGRLRYKGRTPINVKIVAKASVLTGNNRQCALAIYKNADYLFGSTDVSTSNGSGRAENLNTFASTVVEYNDEIYCKIGNFTNSGNITVPNFSCFID